MIINITNSYFKIFGLSRVMEDNVILSCCYITQKNGIFRTVSVLKFIL